MNTFTLTKDILMAALAEISHPDGNGSIVERGLVSGVVLRDGKAGCVLNMDERAPEATTLADRCRQRMQAVPGITSASVVFTQDVSEAASPAPRKAPSATPQPLPHVKKIVAVASGKGGVGKSTTAVCLALALAESGTRVGLLDADIYGPSLPTMLGLKAKPDYRDNLIQPLEKYGIKAMSIGFLADHDGPLVWRGPMLHKAMAQLLRGVAWGTEQAPLDVLLIDMPPGTGDVQLSAGQQLAMDGAVIVTTPQEVAAADARKAAEMFRRVGVPVLGIVENMSYFIDPASGNKTALFGSGGGQKMADHFGVPLLGQVPLLPEVGAALDIGNQPLANSAPAHAAYSAIADSLLKHLHG